MRLYGLPEGIAREEDGQLHVLELASLDELLARGEWIDSLADAPSTQKIPLADAVAAGRWSQLLRRPGQFIIAGLNYRAHCEEIGVDVPQRLVFGAAPGSAVHCSGLPVRMPEGADSEVDYEGEIGLVIGRSADGVTADEAWDYVAGIMPLNDVSARDVQAERSLEAVAKAKGFPTFKPCGPWLFTSDEFANRNDIHLRTWVNGELRQEGRSSDMVFDIPTIISVVSAKTPLSPGDVVCTGTPGGVAHGGAHPYLQAGDVVSIQLEEAEPLTNVFSK